eukprot:CAMPEP_0206273716 /NCGR_PEP_ID=MMETSP0047_2-20121206/34757_1 /ASSEMBLY_ACC=CAM_ASM_000192 /TAXON_ID=195065 /ORGANISM="Chroomonas mesostigmatica_cf, Strain CCMP1168" /LENGTH=487 /DNA_ID=CAMNT_0053702857 /DNA_START=191 /DNA_END=1654 /DNA_ORIENTATION=+
MQAQGGAPVPDDGGKRFSRRTFARNAALAFGGFSLMRPAESLAKSTLDPEGRSYGLWWTLPVAPFRKRTTIMSEVVPGQVWTFDQKFGSLYIQVPIRMTVVKLSQGGLLVYGPVSATDECVGFVKALEKEHGKVKHIILPSVSIEHKVNAGPFARNFPLAHLYLPPDLYSFPFGVDSLGAPGYTQLFWGTEPKKLPDPKDAPWREDLDHLLLGPLKFNNGKAPGQYEEVAMMHKATRTLLVTDIVQTVDSSVPKVFDDDPRALIFHARENVKDQVKDTPEVRDKGWKRVVLLALFFQPGGFNTVPLGMAFSEARETKMPELGWNGFYPFDYRQRGDPHGRGRAFWEESFKALEGKVFVPPLLQELVLDREPVRVLAFADKIAQWDFERIIPAHFSSPAAATPKQFRAAFSFLETGTEAFPESLEVAPLCGDDEFLRSSSEFLVRYGASGAPDPAVERARKARRAGSASAQTSSAHVGTRAGGQPRES